MKMVLKCFKLEYLLVSVFFCLCTCYFTYPLVSDFGGSFIAEKQNSDANQYVWNSYIFKENLLAGDNPFKTDKLLVPAEANLFMHTYSPLMGLFSLAFENPVLANNIFLFLHFLLAALGAYVLAKKILINHLAALLVAVLFAFSPFRMFHLPQHYHLILHGFAPWFMIAFLRWWEIRTTKNLLILCWIWLLNLGCDYYITVFLVYFVGVFLLYKWLMPSYQNANKRKLFFILITCLIACHFIIGYLQDHVDSKAGFYWGGDLANFFIPNQNCWLLSREFFVQYISRMKYLLSSFEHQIYLGLTTLLLTGIFLFLLIAKRNQIRFSFWHLLSLIFVMIALPSVNFFGYRLFYPPTALAHFIPFFNNIRCPTRILSLLHFTLPLCCMLVIIPILVEKWGNRFVNTFLAVLLLFSFLDLKAKTFNTLGKADMPQAIKKLAASAEGTLLTIPTGITDGMKSVGHFDLNQLYFQTIHRKALIGGYISRLPESIFALYESDSVMSRLLCFSKTGLLPQTTLTESEISSFHKTFHPDYVFVATAYNEPQLRPMLSKVFPEPNWSYERIGNGLLLTRHRIQR
ncbi:MAG: hypothetical protein EXR21_07765 [Flavobacteriaceae bacterium]|nr:hypothetical protein [Flavobacteriaceae bacterium]